MGQIYECPVQIDTRWSSRFDLMSSRIPFVLMQHASWSSGLITIQMKTKVEWSLAFILMHFHFVSTGDFFFSKCVCRVGSGKDERAFTQYTWDGNIALHDLEWWWRVLLCFVSKWDLLHHSLFFKHTFTMMVPGKWLHCTHHCIEVGSEGTLKLKSATFTWQKKCYKHHLH